MGSSIKDKDAAWEVMVSAMDAVPQKIITEMVQLVKQNSIDGSKAAEVDVVYTPWPNLRKEDSMNAGQVGFKEEKHRRMVKNAQKDKDIVKALEKTREERKVDFAK